MKEIKMFKAKKQTHRFRKNQKVFVTHESSNHVYICFRWRGNGRYVSGIIQKFNNNGKGWNKTIGNEGLKTICVDDDFAERLRIFFFDR